MLPQAILRNLCALAAVLVAHGPLLSSAIGSPEIQSVEVGFRGVWKLGHWAPLRVEVEGLEDAADSSYEVQVIAPDSDGVPVVAATLATGGGNQWLLTTRIGRREPLVVRLLDGDRVLAERTAPVDSEPSVASRGLPATATLVVRVGDWNEKLNGLAPAGAVFANVESPADLPTDWAAYEGVDLLVIEASAADKWKNIAADDPQVAAIVQWVEAGGRVLLSLGDGAETLIRENGPLAALAPGEFRRTVSLPDLVALERYAESDELDESLEGSLRVAQLEGVAGVIEMHGPGAADDLPLAVRTPRGLGEVFTLTFDVDDELLARWPEREPLLRRFVDGEQASDAAVSSQLRRSSNELGAMFRQRLGKTLAGVGVTPFLVIVGATLLYLAVIGPGDYFFVKRVLGRMSLTWLTFGLVVVATAAGVVGASLRQRGDRVVVNQVELVDVDTISGRLHGRLWAEVYSPRGQRFTVRVAPRSAAGEPLSTADTRLGWFGQPGAGLAGMQANTGVLPLRSAYALGDDASDAGKLTGLPINAASTKTLTASWRHALSDVDGRVSAELVDSDSGLVEGTLTNNTGATLKNARLLHGDWAWRLKPMAPGQVVLIDETLRPIKITSLLRADLGGANRTINVDALDATGLLKLMLFYKQAGGQEFVQREHHYLRSVDLSHQLAAGRAVLLAEIAGEGSPLINAETDQPLAEPNESDSVLYRYVLPVGR